MSSSVDLSNTITQATNTFIHAFSGYTSQLMTWGTWLFLSLMVINLGWLAIGYAFEKDFTASMADFVKRFFIMMVFYTIMTHPDWLLSIASSFQFMGQQLTNMPVDPSSIIYKGIVISNKITQSIHSVNIFRDFYGALVVAAINAGVLFAFFATGLRLAVILIINTALVVASSFFLGFAALGATHKIAHHCIDTILANCARLLGIYIVVGAGSSAMDTAASQIPQTFSGSFDAYLWLLAIVLLFWFLAKELPEQFARLVSHTLTDLRGVDAAAVAMSAVKTAQTAIPAVKAASAAVAQASKVIGSIGGNAASHFMANKTDGIGAAAISAISGATSTSAKNAIGTIGDHLKNAADKLSGGQGIGTWNPETQKKEISGFSSRMHGSTQQVSNDSSKK